MLLHLSKKFVASGVGQLVERHDWRELSGWIHNLRVLQHLLVNLFDCRIRDARRNSDFCTIMSIECILSSTVIGVQCKAQFVEYST